MLTDCFPNFRYYLYYTAFTTQCAWRGALHLTLQLITLLSGYRYRRLARKWLKVMSLNLLRYRLTDLIGILCRGIKSSDDYIAPFPPRAAMRYLANFASHKAVSQCISHAAWLQCITTVHHYRAYSLVKLHVISELVVPLTYLVALPSLGASPL
jgi:hypothetical protein